MNEVTGSGTERYLEGVFLRGEWGFPSLADLILHPWNDLTSLSAASLSVTALTDLMRASSALICVIMAFISYLSGTCPSSAIAATAMSSRSL